MIFKIVMSCLGCLLMTPSVFADVYSWQIKQEGTPDQRPGPRAFFASAHDYDHFNSPEQSNALYVHGGIGPDSARMDRDGALWYLNLEKTTNRWNKILPVAFSPLPPARTHLAGVVWPFDYQELGSTEERLKPFRVFVTFGGLDDSNEPLDNLWVCSEIFTNSVDFGMDRFWVWSEVPKPTGTPAPTWPSPRSQHRMVYIPPSGTQTDPRIFLSGGIDENGDPLFDAYLGTLTFNLEASVTSNPWQFTLSIGCEWEDLDLAETDLENVGVYGHSAVYDPYFDLESRDLMHPRVLMYGGYNEKSDMSDTITAYDLVDESWYQLTPVGDIPIPRAYHACSLDPREHRLVVHGGKETRGKLLNDLLFFDLTTLTWSESDDEDTPYRYGHDSAYFWFTIFGGITEESSSEVFKDDTQEYQSDDPCKEWEITPDGEFGLDNPSTLLNTPRIKGGDRVKIHSGGQDHYYITQFVIPSYIGHITIEGVTHEGCKPALFWPFSPISGGHCFGEYDQKDTPVDNAVNTFFRFGNNSSFVIEDGSGITLRNLRIGHYDDTPDDAIPSAILDELALIDNSDCLLLRDPGILVHAPTQIDACEFTTNIQGITMICVSTVGSGRAIISNCRFDHNYIGVVELETSHDINTSLFENNYLTGILLEKGAHGMAHDNLFFENGGFQDADTYWRSGILSSFDITSAVPLVQTPLIFNNTFVNNYNTLSITERLPSAQYINMPLFMNNIVYRQRQSHGPGVICFTDIDRCRYRSHSNMYYWSGDLLSEADRCLLSVTDQVELNPQFSSISNNDFHLNSNSPAINAGFNTLSPGIVSEGEFSDYHYQDIGYHFPNASSEMGEVTDLSVTDQTLSWDTPTYGTPQGYIVIWEDGTGYIIGSIHLSALTTSYEVPEAMTGVGIWFGVSAFSSSGQFGSPVFIQL